ncbi:hypothetical protein PMY35_07650 [Clostridium tertium]|uniref:hypothetical protein n=1 Tax=Clostridium tertium TaxID=1559 RepID=UPI00189CB949|nr:hypothetical protein [Clostridium tertium]MDB1947693.1 hypothetical protein [Clostridium tertium]
MTNEELFFDTDCISAFLWVKRENILLNLLTGKIIIPQPVYDELTNPCVPHIRNKVVEMENDKLIRTQKIELGTEEYEIYYELAISPPNNEKKIGKGEAAAIAMAKVYGGTIASNNLRDISKYVTKYGLKHVTTGDILLNALNDGIITEDEGNVIWGRMLSKRRKLPTTTFTEYLESKK